MKIYLDNASTTPLDKNVLETMMPYMVDYYGSPSSIHEHGRRCKVAIEKARKCIASILGVSASEIYFTSGGTEGNNIAICGVINSLGLTNVITSPIEHYSVLNPIKNMFEKGMVRLHFVHIDNYGKLDFNHLEYILKNYSNALVSLMHANNEIGNINDLVKIGDLCNEHSAVFHTDAVQSIGHCKMNLQTLPVHLLVASAHKFHGPKGIGFIYIKNDIKVTPIMHGGNQEKGVRSGTENVPAIVGLSQAMQNAYLSLNEDIEYVKNLKSKMIDALRNSVFDVTFNGQSAYTSSLHTILSVSLPSLGGDEDMLVFNLDIRGISVSSGSACSSGTNLYSHVLDALKMNKDRNYIRFSFSKYNTISEIDYVVEQIVDLYKKYR